MKHFHGQSHMKGGLNLDPNTIPPNAKYWRNSANDALIRLGDVIGEEKARKMTENIEGTWREIHTSILILATLAEKQHQTKDVVNVQTKPQWMASVRKHGAF